MVILWEIDKILCLCHGFTDKEKDRYIMIYFNNDYSEGAHPKILEKLAETNMEQTSGYGQDEYCKQAAEKIKELCGNNELDVHFLVGGTQTNLTVIAAVLRTFQGVIGAETAHINVHETGAIESCGHKVLALPSSDGKITAQQVDEYYQAHVNDESHEHTVCPKMVYISQPTELGTLYTKSELQEISNVCRKNRLFLFVDGARLGYGLAAKGNDVTLQDMAEYADVFYIGGTKVGALFGEAVVIKNDYIKEDFRYVMKQKGGMLAKGRLLGIQFLALFEENLYMELSEHADRMADRLRETFDELKVPYLVENTTNQIFPILPDEVLEELKKKFAFSYMNRVDAGHSAVRFCTSWATKEENVERLQEELKALKQANIL